MEEPCSQPVQMKILQLQRFQRLPARPSSSISSLRPCWRAGQSLSLDQVVFCAGVHRSVALQGCLLVVGLQDLLRPLHGQCLHVQHLIEVVHGLIPNADLFYSSFHHLLMS